MALALERMIAPLTGIAARKFSEAQRVRRALPNRSGAVSRRTPFCASSSEAAGSKLEISVVFTSVKATLAALKEAGNLAKSLGGRITLFVPQIVPYPLPLSRPPVPVDFSERRLFVIANNCRVETRVSIYLCREAAETLQSVLKPCSLVVVGTRNRWWPTAEKRLAAKLRRFGHQVVVKEWE